MTRELTDDLASLVKQLDKKVAENKAKKLTCAIVYLNDDKKGSEKALQAFEKKNSLKKIAIASYDAAGPKKYKIAKEAEVTVMLWVNKKIAANHALAAGKLNSKTTTAIISDTSKILK